MNGYTFAPSSPESEAAVVASAILHPNTIPELVAMLPDSGLMVKATNIGLYDAALALWRDGVPVNEHTVADKAIELMPAPFDASRDLAMFAIDEIRARAARSGVQVYAKMVHKAGVRRAIIREMDALMKAAASPLAAPHALLEQASGAVRSLAALNAHTPPSDAKDVDKAIAELEQVARTQQVSGISTGNRAFDRATLGLRRGGISIIVGGSGTGKTHFVWGLLDSIEAAGTPTAMVQGEMTGVELVTRQVAGVESHRDALDGNDVTHAFERLNSYKERVKGRNRIAAVRSMELDSVLGAIAMLAATGAQVVVVDYIQQVWVRGVRGQDETRDVFNAMKECARQLNIHIILASQLTAAINRDKSAYAISRHDAYGGTLVTAYADLILTVVWPYGVRNMGKQEGIVWFELAQSWGDETAKRAVACHIVKDRFGASSDWIPWWTNAVGLSEMWSQDVEKFKAALRAAKKEHTA